MKKKIFKSKKKNPFSIPNWHGLFFIFFSGVMLPVWLSVIFPVSLTILNLSHSNYDISLDYLVNLIDLLFDSVYLDDWSRVIFPTQSLKKLYLDHTNFNQSNIIVIFFLNLKKINAIGLLKLVFVTRKLRRQILLLGEKMSFHVYGLRFPRNV